MRIPSGLRFGYGGNACSGKNAWPCGSAPPSPGAKAGWPNTCFLRLTNPEGRQYHITAAFPSACGKTNLAMIQPTIPGWKAECIGDDIAWMKIAPDGRLRRSMPKQVSSVWRRGPPINQTRWRWKPLRKNTIFTNCALTDDGDISWEGMKATQRT